MATSYILLGPPEATGDSGDLFVDLRDENFNKASPRKGLTENQSATFVASGDACLDFFFQVVPNSPASTVVSLLAAAWVADPTTALRLVCNLRGVRGSGKSDRKGFYAAALWLHAHHPATLALNAGAVAGEFGYLKDLPEILHRLVNGGRSTRTPGRKARGYGRKVRFASRGYGRRARFARHGYGPRHRTKAPRGSGTTEERVAASLRRDQALSEAASVARRRRRAEIATRAVERYSRDPAYRFLHDRTADLFAGLLADDLQKLAAGKSRRISLAAKWCPSLDSSYDRSTLLCEAIARRLFPKNSAPELGSDIPDAHYAYRARERLRKVALVPLRRALELPEVHISARAWGSVVYERVASVAMKNYKELFAEHDGERFGRFLAEVEEGKKKIAAGALLPHEILASDDKAAELQWRRMVDDLRAHGKLTNCIAVCDVSGSMIGTPMDVCVALGLLVSELSDEPWKGRVVTFSKNPQLHLITGDTIAEKTEFIGTMEWGMNTNFQAVFNKLLEVAVAGRLPPERMVKRVFVFSDMEFDQASSSPWETDYEEIRRKFGDAGYGAVIPEMVFWNLRDSKAVPVPAGENGVALVSGYSKNLLKLFLEGGGIVSPRAIMEKAIAGPEYQKLVVFD